MAGACSRPTVQRAGLLITGSQVRTHSGACLIINVTSLSVRSACLAEFSLNNVHKGGLKQHNFSFLWKTDCDRHTTHDELMSQLGQ